MDDSGVTPSDIKTLEDCLLYTSGRLAAACRAVSDAGINMHALNLADTSDFGVVRMLTDTPEAAAEALREQGYRATVTPVLAVRVPNVPGGLAKLLAVSYTHLYL